jgi:adenylylsulfate kinase
MTKLHEGATLTSENRGHGLAIWLTGLSGSGKTTLAVSVHAQLSNLCTPSEVFDSDILRPQISGDLGFSSPDRAEHVKRLAMLATDAACRGSIAIICAVSPFRAGRDAARTQFRSFIEVFIDAPVEVCELRDPTGLYRRFRRQEIHGIAGIDAPYQRPERPEVHCHTDLESITDCTQQIVRAVLEKLTDHPLSPQST